MLGWVTTVVMAGGTAGLMGEAPPAQLEPLVVTGELATGSVLLGRDLGLFQADSVADLSGLIPGFNVVTSDTRGYGDILSMRGSTNTLFFSPPAVGMVIDDVPQGEVFGYPSGLLQMEQVRLLRGPQGAGYGRNGAVGMIEMVTPGPGEKWNGSLTTEFGSDDMFGASLRSGGPLGKDWSHTLQLYHQERDGYIHNATLGRETDDRSLTGGLANLYWKSSPDTEWRLRVWMERADDGSQRLSSLSAANPFRVESEVPGENDMERNQVSLHWTRVGPWGRVKSITAWQDWKLDPNITDLDLINSGQLFRSTIHQDQEMWTQEFRWESPEDAGPWSWRGGVFFMDQAVGGDALREFAVFGWPIAERTVYDLDQWNVAAYGRATYAWNDKVDVHGGLRVEYVDVAIDRLKTSNIAWPSEVRDDLGECYVSPELGVTVAVSDLARVFARSAIGIKPAGFSAFASNPLEARYDEETAWANEMGIEVTSPEHRVAASLTAFCNWIDDYQLNRNAVGSTDFLTVNAGEVTSLGVEGQLRWQPVDGLTLLANAGCVQAEFDANDRAVPYVPEFSGSLGVRYDLPRGFYVQTSLRGVGETFFDEANDVRYREGSYACWDAEIGYAHEQFAVALFGRNMTDELYYTFMNPQINAGAPGDPQVFGVRASLEF